MGVSPKLGYLSTWLFGVYIGDIGFRESGLGFPKIRGSFLEVPTIRIEIF